MFNIYAVCFTSKRAFYRLKFGGSIFSGAFQKRKRLFTINFLRSLDLFL